MQLLRLTRASNGSDVYINPKNVSAVVADEEGTVIHCTKELFVIVTEKLDEVVSLINLSNS